MTDIIFWYKFGTRSSHLKNLSTELSGSGDGLSNTSILPETKSYSAGIVPWLPMNVGGSNYLYQPVPSGLEASLMYIPLKYTNENLEEIMGFIRENSFAILVNQVNGKPWASHIPLELKQRDDGSSVLEGHLAKANMQWRSFEKKPEVLVIFNGPHSYVSSSWYKQEEVPTWNYIAVHIYGKIYIQNETELYESLTRLVDRYEQDSENPVSVAGFSRRTMRQIKGVVGFEISIDKIQAAYKLSQGRKEDHEAIMAQLEKRDRPGSREIAKAMRQRGKWE